MTTVMFPAGLQSIGSKAFYETMITELVINGNYTFEGGTGHYFSDADWTFGACTELKKATINSNITQLVSAMFVNCRKLIEVMLPKILTTIGSGAFMNCTSLVQINIPASVQVIESSAFANSGLAALALPQSIKSIKDDDFKNCKALKDLTVPDSVIKIDFGTAFKRCTFSLQTQSVLKRLGYRGTFRSRGVGSRY